jgi:K+-transporting ATPase ATPase C chain
MTTGILRELGTCVRALAVVIVLGCVLYPLAVLGIGQTLMPHQANGSLVDEHGRPATPDIAVGSILLGQAFSSPEYFHPRPSAAGAGYDAASSSGTNLGPLSAKLLMGVDDDPATADVDESFAGIDDLAQAYRAENGLADDAVVPADAVTRSASGLDPHISPANAALQVARVAKARHVEPDRVHQLVERLTLRRDWDVFGEPRVNVLELNLALAGELPMPAGPRLRPAP